MEHNRLGLMGHYYGGMLDIYSDLTLQCATFGGHIELIEVDELAALRRAVSEDEMKRRTTLRKSSTCSRIVRRRIARAPPARRWRSTGWWRAMRSGRSRITTGRRHAENEDAISSIILGY